MPERRDVHDLPVSSPKYVAPFRFGPFSILAMVFGVAIAVAGLVADLPEDPRRY